MVQLYFVTKMSYAVQLRKQKMICLEGSSVIANKFQKSTAYNSSKYKMQQLAYTTSPFHFLVLKNTRLDVFFRKNLVVLRIFRCLFVFWKIFFKKKYSFCVCLIFWKIFSSFLELENIFLTEHLLTVFLTKFLYKKFFSRIFPEKSFREIFRVLFSVENFFRQENFPKIFRTNKHFSWNIFLGKCFL